MPFIPTETELDALINDCEAKTSVFLQMLKETGMRAGEAHNLRWAEIFANDLRTIRKVFEKQRANIARKLQNPRINQIHFHTFRHWKTTMLYHQTKDILYVMRVLGHKNIKNTLIYTHLVDGLKDEEYICRVARTPEEIAQLIEAGFEYVCEHDGLKFFRKRK